MKNSILFFVFFLPALHSIGQEKKWHELEGYFQSQSNKDLVVQFIAQDSIVFAKLLWNGGSAHLLPDTGLAFVSREQGENGPLHLVFHREPSGAVNQVDVSPDNGLWVRVPNYKPAVLQEMAHTPEQLQKFAGLYQLKEDNAQYVQLTVDNNSLTIHQQWDGGTRENFVPSAEGKFFEKDFPRFTLDFSQDQQGRYNQFLALGRDHWVRVEKPTLSAAQLKTYEGKFRSQEDPDNMVQLIAADKSLIVKELWNKKEITLEPVTNTYFNNGQRSFPLQIILESGKVNQIIILGNQSFVRIE
ncbi:MAG TPA: hypothetical protein VNV35_11945 [Puia sp.]|jgi:hypothetical protein|nr:hypothetical protein [Puia sp.]